MQIDFVMSLRAVRIHDGHLCAGNVCADDFILCWPPLCRSSLCWLCLWWRRYSVLAILAPSIARFFDGDLRDIKLSKVRLRRFKVTFGGLDSAVTTAVLLEHDFHIKKEVSRRRSSFLTFLGLHLD